MTEKKDDDGRKDDDGSAGPRPHGAKQGDVVEELAARAKFLKDVHAKVVEPAERAKPKGTSGAQSK